MTCDEARELIGADPETASPDLLAHLKACPGCAAYREQMQALNVRIRRAMEFDWKDAQAGSPGGPARPPTVPLRPHAEPSAPPRSDTSNVTPFRRRERALLPKHQRPGLFTLAASFAAALLVGLTLWLSQPTESLAAAVVNHVEGEPDSWSGTRPVAAEQLETVLRKSGVKLGSGMQPVVYASACWFRGRFVPHFVVTTKDGPVTVMILLKETVPAAQRFSENGYSGLLMPARAGSVAVLSRSPMELEKPAREVVRALQSAN